MGAGHRRGKEWEGEGWGRGTGNFRSGREDQDSRNSDGLCSSSLRPAQSPSGCAAWKAVITLTASK